MGNVVKSLFALFAVIFSLSIRIFHQSRNAFISARVIAAIGLFPITFFRFSIALMRGFFHRRT